MSITVRTGGLYTHDRVQRRKQLNRLRERCKELSLSHNETEEIIYGQLHIDYFYEIDKSFNAKRENSDSSIDD